MTGNQLILGDNLEILKTIPSESVDLIYIDPPFFSNRNYEVIWGDEGEIRSFKDRWAGGMEHYIAWLKERVEEMHRILKPNGSFYLHCDWHADAYIRVGILDKVFGMNNFRNEIVWHYGQRMMHNKYKFNSKHDSILFYAKSDKTTINIISSEWTKDEISKSRARKIMTDECNREYILDNRSVSKGYPEKKQYIDDIIAKGKPIDDVWDLPFISSTSKERIGYPTQKPEALLERIIKASSNEGDVVMDCFCGGGTTIAVADKLNRKWIGVDQSVQAIKVSEQRLYNQKGLFQAPFSVKLHKYDYDTIRNSEAFQFESWIVEQFGGESNAKQRGDMGIDGKKNGVPIQVKRSDNIGRDVIDRFPTAMERFYGGSANLEKRKGSKEVDGYVIAFSFGKGAVEEVARVKNDKGLIIKLIKVEDIIPIAKKPNVEITFEDKGLNEKSQRIINFIANTKSKIELFQWDFNYKIENGFKAEVMLDKTGTQVNKFTAGEYFIACKIIDEEGIEALEVIKLKINGIVAKVDQ